MVERRPLHTPRAFRTRSADHRSCGPCPGSRAADLRLPRFADGPGPRRRPLRQPPRRSPLLDALQSCAQPRTKAATGAVPEVDDVGCPSASPQAAIPSWKARSPAARAFVPNDCDLSPDRRVLLLTGPNMAGKSTYLRQNALLAILAQAGLPVPASTRPDRRGGPIVQPGGRRGRTRARPLHLHGRNDRDRRHPAPGRPAQPRHRGRNRPRHRHPGRARHRLGRARSPAQPGAQPYHFRHPFPRTRTPHRSRCRG